MKVILLKDVPKLGKKDEIKEVKSGYAYNMLFKNKLAVEATEDKIRKIEELKQAENKRLESREKELHSLIDSLDGKTFEMKVPANDKGHLFSKLKLENLLKIPAVAGMTEMDSGITRSEGIKEVIIFPEIKSLGDFDIKLEREEKKGKFTLRLS